MPWPTRRDVHAGLLALGAAACAPRRSSARATGMVATSEREATEAGIAILRAGGNAADAAVAAAAALSVIEPMMTGLGGDCFALYYDAATRQVTALNGSGRSPARLTLDLATAQGMSAIPLAHGHAVTVPGTCAGWSDLLERHGRSTLAEVLAPAIRLADEGFVVAPRNAEVWTEGAPRLFGQPGGGAALLIAGRAPDAGVQVRNPGLALALRAIAADGRDAFYLGPIAEAIVRTVTAAGGVIELADLASHTSTWDAPVSIDYRGHRIWECPPNGQGLVPLIALNLLDGFELGALDPLGPERLHLVIEALRLAFADARAYIADPRHAPVPIDALLSRPYAQVRRASIDPKRAAVEVPHGVPLGRTDTVYLCTVDGDGNACSFINSVFFWFGSGLIPGATETIDGAPHGYGFVLQNRGASFTLEPGHPNALAPGKRPYHTLIPGMITRPDGSLYGPFGVMGGFMQPQGHVQLITALVDDGAAPQAAIDRPRLCVQPLQRGPLWPTDGKVSVLLEENVPTVTAEALRAMGHEIEAGVGGTRRTAFGRGQMIRVGEDGALDGGSDPRADGEAASTR